MLSRSVGIDRLCSIQALALYYPPIPVKLKPDIFSNFIILLSAKC